MESVTPLCSIPLWTKDDVRALTSLERNCLVSQEEKITSGGGRNYITVNKQLLDLEPMADFKALMTHYLDHYANTIMGLNAEFYITDSWATRNPQNTGHTRHSHPNSIFSGIYYVDVEQGDLELAFDTLYNKDFRIKYDIKEYNLFNSSSWTIGPKPGLLVIFPSWVMHNVLNNPMPTDRRIIGFNSFVRGRFGEDSSVDNVEIK